VLAVWSIFVFATFAFAAVAVPSSKVNLCSAAYFSVIGVTIESF